VAGYFDTNRFICRAPEAAADSMLTEGMNFYRTLTPGNRPLNLLFKYP
jgi:hypothetical protein